MKRLLRAFLATSLFFCFHAINGLYKSRIRVVNNTNEDFKINQIIDFEGEKVVPTYKTKKGQGSIKDLEIEGFYCYVDGVNWKCIREGQRQALQETIISKADFVDITVEAHKSKTIVRIDRDQPSIKSKIWEKKVLDSAGPVPDRLEVASSRVYPFQGKSFRLVGGGGYIDISVISERLGSLNAFKKALAAGLGAGAAALLIPGSNLISSLSVGLFAAIPTGIIDDQRSFLSTREDIKGVNVAVSYKSIGLPTPYRGIEIILNPTSPKQEPSQEFQMW